MKRSIPQFIRLASRHRRASIPTTILFLFLISFGGAVVEAAADGRTDDCTTVVVIVDGMMKSRSGAT